MHNFIYNTRHVVEADRRIKDRVQKLQQMLVKEFSFKPPQSEESRLQQQLSRMKLGKDYEESSEEEGIDDDLPVIVDPNEHFIRF
jgi:hypothetical protein